jgi:hypothetical protein
MREIKFRAMATVNNKHNGIKAGDFVYGHYIESGCDAPCIIFGDGEQVEVDKNTLGQLTGQKDETGTEIYEDDISASQDDHASSFKLGQVVFTECGAWTVKGFFGHYEYLGEASRLVIGNVHQHPGLLTTEAA